MAPLPLVVVALGGNAVSPPRPHPSFGDERAAIAAACRAIATLARPGPLGPEGARLLVVHGNGPQVGRLLAAPDYGDPAALDVHVAQTQGELGYLIAAALDSALGTALGTALDTALGTPLNAAPLPTVAVITRVLVDPDDPGFATPTKPVGAVLATPPAGVPGVAVPGGWRRVVASPEPHMVVELEAVRRLLERQHVVAGGGGGVPLATTDAHPLAAVIDKDRVAAWLAVALDAAGLIFLTDVPAVLDGFGRADARALPRLTVAEATRLEAAGAFAPGSMGPKMASAVAYVRATGRPALITQPGDLEAARRGAAGTTVIPDDDRG